MPTQLWDYDQHRSIRFRPDAALLRGDSRFEVHLAHPGFLFAKPVTIHLVDSAGATAVPFERSSFRYEGPSAHLARSDAPELEGFAGFRVLFPLNEPSKMDEIAVFQGASYFRLVGPGQVFGLSSRGLAVDIAGSGPEEFPDFREFWIEQPEPLGPQGAPASGVERFVVHALLDSPSVTGAFRFELLPAGTNAASTTSQVAVQAKVFARTDVARLGVAPMSSMFLYGPGGAGTFDDFRTAVHDSDGLMAWTGTGEWIWRPLSNGTGLQVSSLRDEDPRGFGLAQRARRFDDYLDIEAQYHRRPSQWVEIEGGDWGSGGVELLEIPTPSEFNDNIAAYWVPDQPLRAGEERSYRYRLITFGERLPFQTLPQVTRTRSGADRLPGELDDAAAPAKARRFVVDFGRWEGGSVPPADSVGVNLQALAGEISDQHLVRLPNDEGWRVSFRVVPDEGWPVDMRLYLERGGEPITETWTYVWYP